MPPRRSTRSTQATATAPAPVVAAPAASSAPAKQPKAKPKAKATTSRKRTAEESDEEFSQKEPVKKKSKKQAKAEVDDAESGSEDKAAKDDNSNMVTVLKRGAAPVDPTCALVGECQCLPQLDLFRRYS